MNKESRKFGAFAIFISTIISYVVAISNPTYNESGLAGVAIVFFPWIGGAVALIIFMILSWIKEKYIFVYGLVCSIIVIVLGIGLYFMN